jgi:hypothetical protein
MSCRRFICLIALTLLVSRLSAEDKTKPPLSTGDPPLVEARMADGSAVKVSLLVESIDINTRYGKLSVPIREVRRIDFGLRYPEGLREKLEDAVSHLGDADFRKREAAHGELLRHGELAYPLLAKATRSGNAEAAKRARAIGAELRNRVPEEKLNFKYYDSVQTTEFPIHGVVEAGALKARSAVFGDTTLKLADLRQLRFFSTGGTLELTIDAAKHGLPHENWLETELEIAGNLVEIRAEGKVDLYPLGGERGLYQATPDGSRPGGRATRYPSGALLGKLGQNGSTFVIGSKYQGIPPGEGKLHLRLEASPWGVVPSGSFTVKASVGK